MFENLQLYGFNLLRVVGPVKARDIVKEITPFILVLYKSLLVGIQKLKQLIFVLLCFLNININVKNRDISFGDICFFAY